MQKATKKFYFEIIPQNWVLYLQECQVHIPFDISAKSRQLYVVGGAHQFQTRGSRSVSHKHQFSVSFTLLFGSHLIMHTFRM